MSYSPPALNFLSSRKSLFPFETGYKTFQYSVGQGVQQLRLMHSADILEQAPGVTILNSGLYMQKEQPLEGQSGKKTLNSPVPDD